MTNPNDYNRNDTGYRRESKSSSGWVIAGLIAIVVIAIALYQGHNRYSAGNVSNIEPAAGNVTTTNTVTPDMQNSNNLNSNTVNP